jgi:hypothetical protein
MLWLAGMLPLLLVTTAACLADALTAAVVAAGGAAVASARASTAACLAAGAALAAGTAAVLAMVGRVLARKRSFLFPTQSSLLYFCHSRLRVFAGRMQLCLRTNGELYKRIRNAFHLCAFQNQSGPGACSEALLALGQEVHGN